MGRPNTPQPRTHGPSTQLSWRHGRSLLQQRPSTRFIDDRIPPTWTPVVVAYQWSISQTQVSPPINDRCVGVQHKRLCRPKPRRRLAEARGNERITINERLFLLQSAPSRLPLFSVFSHAFSSSFRAHFSDLFSFPWRRGLTNAMRCSIGRQEGGQAGEATACSCPSPHNAHRRRNCTRSRSLNEATRSSSELASVGQDAGRIERGHGPVQRHHTRATVTAAAQGEEGKMATAVA
uniref:Uncharacterized protein n=2 Tax=Oryza TaxID=4527 RepID=A0A0E0PD34_ORYRU